MTLEIYSPKPGDNDDKCYAVEKGTGLLHFTVQLESSKLNLCLFGQPRDFVFVADSESEVDIVVKKYNWVAKFAKESSDFWIVNGFFSDFSKLDDELIFLDEDALVMGPKGQISAAVYRKTNMVLVEATYISNSLENWSPAERRELQPKMG